MTALSRPDRDGFLAPRPDAYDVIRHARALGVVLVIALTFGSAPVARAGWRTFTTLDGLGSNSVSSVFVDESGAIWVGTLQGGVSRYDGAGWTQYQAPNTLPSNRVNAIAQDRSGNLWFGTDQGATRYDGATWTHFSEIGGIRSNPVTAILQDRAGSLWFGTSLGGVARYDGTNWTTYTTANGLVSNSVTALCQDRRDTLWVGFTQPGISHFGGETWTTIQQGALGLPIQGTSIVEDRNGTLWFSGNTVLWSYDGASWRSSTSGARGLTDYGITGAAFVDRDGAVWLSELLHGVSRYDGVRWRNYSARNTAARDELASDEVTAIAQDLGGNLWFGTAANGVTQFDGSTWRFFDLPNSPSLCYDCGVLDGTGTLWFGLSSTRVGRFNGSVWTYVTGGINDVRASLADRSGKLWFAGTESFQTLWAGVTRFDPRTQTFTPTPRVDAVLDLFEDRLGYIWAGLDGTGAARFNGTTWFVYNTANTGGALPGSRVTSIAEDSSGLLWFAANGGLVTFDGLEWRQVRPAKSGNGRVERLLVDRAGRLWLAGPMHLERRDGESWTTFTRDEGVPATQINSFIEDRDGNLWLTTSDHGAIRFNGEQWGFYSATDGLGGDAVGGAVVDTSGTLWFEFPRRLSRLDPDTRPPQTVLTLRTPGVSANRAATVGFAAFGETYGVHFSTSFDDGPWSAWSTELLWSTEELSDGRHQLRVRSRDKIGNVDPSPAIAEFEVDATPPEARLDAPAAGQAVRDSVAVMGTAADLRLREFRLELRPAGSPDWGPSHVTLLARGARSVTGEILAWWNTRDYPDGGYDLRLSVSDTLGLAGAVTIAITVDNGFPSVDHTSPARVRAPVGGDVYTTDGEIRLYFPPYAFAEDATVTVRPLVSDEAPEQLPSGALKAWNGAEFLWPATLAKPARLAIRMTGAIAGGHPTLYRREDSSGWARLGGTWDERTRLLELTVRLPGRYAAYLETEPTPAAGGLSAIEFTPRVFSPRGRFADREVGISFTLGRTAPVSIRVYSVSGRLIRDVATGQAMSAGINLVRWDGRDREGSTATDGMYLVTVEALGRIEKKTLAVVR